MRERIKCSECGLVQWSEGYCKRCGADFGEVHEIFVPPPEAAASASGSSPPDGPPTLGSLPGMLPPTPDASTGGSGYGDITPEIVVSVENSSRWVQICGFLGIIAGILIIVVGFLVAFFLRGVEDPGPALNPFTGFLYMLLGVYVWYAFTKLRAAGRAATEVRSDGEEALLQAIEGHGEFWRLMGLLAVFGIGLGVLYGLYVVLLT